MKIDYEKLKVGLEGLTGNDYERIERSAKRKGEFDPASLSFAGQLASAALDIPYPEIKNLPLAQYLRVCTETAGFLNGAWEAAQSGSSTEVSPSDAPNTEELDIG